MTSGVQFPGVDKDSELGRATADHADCADCEWTIAPACLSNDPTVDLACANAVNSCPAPAVMYHVYLRTAGGPWNLVVTTCLGPNQRPTSVADVGALVRERVVNLLPDARPSFQPPDGGLVNLPTLFAAGEPASIRTEPFDVLGFRVVVTATAHWDWTFDAGVTQSFDKPGGRYPDDDVAYTYAGPGERRVSVRTTWDASYTVDGDGPFAVPGPALTKTSAPMTVPVREARSELIGG